MRDLLIITLVVLASLAALRRPWVGILAWTWLSIMNPHRYAFGLAYDAPLAAMVAVTTLLGALFTRDKHSPFGGPPVKWFTVFVLWITISWLAGLDREADYPQWNKVMKIDFMILVALALVNTRRQIMLLAWVVVASLALLGVKGGLFTILTGGSYRVWGPPDSFIYDNNEFALAMVMTVPLLRFLQLQMDGKWIRNAMSLAMALCIASALGSYSRGGMLAALSMALYFWWRSKNKLMPAILMVLVGAALLAFMPEQWAERMSSVQSYEQDRSAMGRISAWWNAWNLAFHYPFGVGFNAARPELFARFSPYPEFVHAAHSIYFQVLGNHGFVGLFIFIGIWVSTWRSASWLIKHGVEHADTRWCTDLGTMSQVCLLAFGVGGAFLSLSYFDLPYNVMVLVVATRLWLQRKAWLKEVYAKPRGWELFLGLVPKAAASRTS